MNFKRTKHQELREFNKEMVQLSPIHTRSPSRRAQKKRASPLLAYTSNKLNSSFTMGDEPQKSDKPEELKANETVGDLYIRSPPRPTNLTPSLAALKKRKMDNILRNPLKKKKIEKGSSPKLTSYRRDSDRMTDELACRICLEKIVDTNSPDACIPCNCTGSISYCHVVCLKEWIKQKKAVECEICHNLYKQNWIVWAFENNYIRNEEAEQPQEDIIDKNCNKFKYIFVTLFGFVILFAIVSMILSADIPMTLSEDVIGVIFRSVALLFVIAGIVIVYQWRKVLEDDSNTQMALELTVQSQIAQIRTFSLLSDIESNRHDIEGFQNARQHDINNRAS